MTMIESDLRKATFLRSMSRELALGSKVLAERIETAVPQAADVVSARALASLPKLIPLAERHGKPSTVYVFPKGRQYQEELEDLGRTWRFDVDVHPSKTDKEAVILILENLERV